jgi:outer membrane protein OmpA-like peptidoglycan-associated protein
MKIIIIKMNLKSYLRAGRIVIMLFAALVFKNISTKAAIKNINPFTIFDLGFGGKNLLDTDTIIISGTIKDDNGNLLENATILFDTVAEAITGKDGRFSFEPKQINPGVHNIYFSCDNFGTVVRTYYSVMLSSNYNVVLYRQINTSKVNPVNKEPLHPINNKTIQPVKKDSVLVVKDEILHSVNADSANASTIIVAEELDFPSIIFKANATALTGEHKEFLDIISEKLKNNPTVKIDIKAYTPEHGLSPLIAEKRVANIIKYLMAKGISADRLIKITEAGGGEENTIDLVKAVQ